VRENLHEEKDTSMPDWLHDTLAALTSLGTWRSYRHVFWLNFLDDGWRYLIAALLIWGVLHVLLRKRLAHRLIADWPTAADLRREITYSISTLLVLAAVASMMLAWLVSGIIEIYQEPLKHGWAWLVLSLPLVIVWHDTYFYWTHRLLHTRWLFRRVHGVHHRSRNPSPWAAFSFHPVEALIQGMVLPTFLLVAPLNEYVVIAFAIHQIARNAHGHAAVETLPRGFVRHWLWGRIVTTTHHHLHHETARGNYGLWFTWWDRWRGTERADYFERFDAATRPRPKPAADAAEAIA
jgi:sterol desaturase/sphingolipid hydroxylase (fatty acid hydroxylase superfamily)